MNGFFLSLILVFLAEMGDKTQLVTLAFATKYKASTVLLGVTVATLLIHLISVFIGRAAGGMLPVFWINLIAGILFVIFGFWTLRDEQIEEESNYFASKLGPFLSVVMTFLISEIGDKTMLTTVAIAAQQHDMIGVWIGSTIGMVLADGLGIVVGRELSKRVPTYAVKVASAFIFFGFGTISVVNAFAKFPRLL